MIQCSACKKKKKKIVNKKCTCLNKKIIFFIYKYSKFHDTRPIHMCNSVNKEMGKKKYVKFKKILQKYLTNSH